MKPSLKILLILLLGLSALASAQVNTSPAGGPQFTRQSAQPVPMAPMGPGAAGQSPFLGGVPSGKAQPGVLPLSLTEAVERGLKHNLGLLIAWEGTREARGARWRALSDLLPDIQARTSESRQQINLRAFGFGGFPGLDPIVGPFDIFDARAFLSQPILDLHAIHNLRAETENQKAANYTYQDARDLVVLVAANLYLTAVTGESRVKAAEAQLQTARALYDQAVDLKKAGVVPAIDLLRSQVELEDRRQRLIYFQNEAVKQKLNLARAIGLPLGQEFALTDRIPYTPLPPMTFEDSLEQAYRSRADYQRTLTQVRAAELSRKAAQGERLPSLQFDADYGDIGPTPGVSHGTFTVAATLTVPIFQGGRVHGKVLQADALLRQRKSELEDLRARIEYEVRMSFLDLKASGERVQVAQSAADLAKEQMKQAQDRFTAGVVNSIEVVQAQEAVATAEENYISSLYTYNLAKASLVRALGLAEEGFKQLLGGKP
jgi:outer membrane protein TolC